jgi:hypothetical protein
VLVALSGSGEESMVGRRDRGGGGRGYDFGG